MRCVRMLHHPTSPKWESHKFLENIAPEKWWWEDFRLSYWVSVTFQGRAVKLREGKNWQELPGKPRNSMQFVPFF